MEQGGPVNFSTLHTWPNYEGTQPCRAAAASLAFSRGAYRLRFHQCGSLIGMPWQLDFAFGSADPAKMFIVPNPHKFFFASIKFCGSRSQNLHQKMLSRRVNLPLTGYHNKGLDKVRVCARVCVPLLVFV